MKATERHQLKRKDKLTETLQDTMARLEAQRTRLVYGAIALVLVLVVAGAYSWYRSQRTADASRLLAEALVVIEAPIAPPPPPPGVSAEPAQATPALSFPTEQARLEAALPKFLEAAEAYPNTSAGITARYHTAGVLAHLGRMDEARQQFQRVMELDGRGLYGRMARLGVADLNVREGNYDEAIATFRELSLDARGDLPVDAVLMQLGAAYRAAGKTAEAQQTFQRLTTDFPDSPYSSAAQQELDALKSSQAS